MIELNPDDVQTLSEIGSQVNPWIPSTIFASVASKGIIFWSLNVFLVVYICGTLHHFITGIPKSRKNKKTYKNHHRQQNQPNREQNRNSSNLAPIEQRVMINLFKIVFKRVIQKIPLSFVYLF